MQTVSEAFHQAAAASVRTVYCRVTVGQGEGAFTVSDGDDLISLTVERRAFTDAKLIGNALPTTAALTLIDREGEYAALPPGTRFAAELGLDTGGASPEYVPLPPLYLDEGGITADTVKRTVTLQLSDQLATAGTQRIAGLPEQTYPQTRMAYLLAVCGLAGLEYGGQAFFGSDTAIPEPPNLSGAETALAVIGRLAEASLCNAAIRADGKLYFLPLSPEADGFGIPPEQYRSLKTQKTYGPVNRLVLARRPQNDDVARQDDASIAADGLCELVIADNPFLDYGQEDSRGTYIDALFAAVKGFAYPGYTLEWKGDPSLEPGDRVTLTDRDEGAYPTLYAAESLAYTGGLKASASAPYPTLSTQMAAGATTVREAVSRAEIAVDKVSGEITAVAETVEETQEYVNGAVEQVRQENSASLAISKDEILNTVSQVYATQAETEALRQEVSSEIRQTAEQVELRFAEAQQAAQDAADALEADRVERETYIRFTADGMELGKTDSTLIARLTNDRLSFLDGGREVAYVSNSKLYITQAEILDNLHLGSFAFEPRASGNLSLVWKG